MNTLVQHIIVLLLVAGCVAFVVRQGVRTFRFKKGGKLGACCAKGCPTEPGPSKTDGGGKRVVFMTSDMIGITRKGR